MYRVWFEGFVDRYYKSYDKAREACRRFIISQKEDKVLTDMMLQEFDKFDEVEELCGITEIRFEDEIEELAQTEKKKYKVVIKKSEVVEVMAYNEEEAEAIADVALDNMAFCWEGPADEVIVAEVF